MKKNVILYILLVFLIIVNGFFLINIMSGGADNKPNELQREKDFIAKELGFTKSQLSLFNEKSKGHHEKIIRLSDEIRVLKDNLFATLPDAIDEKTIDSISSLICDKETEREKEIYYHFKMIRDIADDKQKVKFENILKDALRQGDIGNGPPPQRGEGHRPPPKDIHNHR